MTKESLACAWKFALKGKPQVAARRPLLAGDCVYQVFNFRAGAGHDGILMCFDKASGTALWEYALDFVTNEPVIDADGSLYVTTFDGSAHAIDTQGKLRWAVRHGRANIFTPVLTGNSLLFAEHGGSGKTTWCLDTSTGAVRWRYEHGGHAYSLAITEERVVHAVAPDGDHPGRLICLSRADGAELWSSNSAEYVFKPLIVGTHIHVGAWQSLRTYDLATGAELARFPLPECNLTSELLVLDGGVVFGDESGMARSLHFDGRQWTPRWEHKDVGDRTSRPVSTGSEIAIHSKAGSVTLLDGASGNERGSLRLEPTDSTGGLAFGAGRLFVAHGRELRCYLAG